VILPVFEQAALDSRSPSAFETAPGREPRFHGLARVVDLLRDAVGEVVGATLAKQSVDTVSAFSHSGDAIATNALVAGGCGVLRHARHEVAPPRWRTGGPA
jgi:hypothetical protein